MRTLVCCLLLLTGFVFAGSPKITTMDEAKAAATKADKPILIEFYIPF